MFRSNRWLKVLLPAVALLAASVLPASASRENNRLLAGAARQAERGDTATALQVIERFLGQPERDPARAYALYLKGVLEAGRGRLDTAEAALRDMVVMYPGSEWMGRGLTRLGTLAYRQSNDTTAVRVLEQLALAFPDSQYTPTALLALGSAARRAGIDRKAVQAFLQYLRNPAEDKPNTGDVLRQCARLLSDAGRDEEAYSLLERIRASSGEMFQDLDLNTQALAVGVMIGMNMPDSSLRLIEEVRRSTGAQMLESARMQFLMGRAYLELGAVNSADSALSGLAGRSGLEAEGVEPDSLYGLLMDLSLTRNDMDSYFRYGLMRVRAVDSPDRALDLLERMLGVAGEHGRPGTLGQAIREVLSRFGSLEQSGRMELIRARLAGLEGRDGEALRILSMLGYGATESSVVARAGLAKTRLLLAAGDSLRAEAEMRDYLDIPEDPLHNTDSVLWVYSSLEAARGGLENERRLLERLVRDYPASEFWERADDRLREIRLFEDSRPSEAADELLDLFETQGANVPPLRLAEIAAGMLGQYDRAVAIMTANPPDNPQERLKLIRYRYLSGLGGRRSGSVEATEKINRAWREIQDLLAVEGDFTGRDDAVSLYIDIYRSIYPLLSGPAISEADSLLEHELETLRAGPARASALLWLGERYLAAAQGDSGYAAMARQDSARAMLSGAVTSGGEDRVVGRAALELARSLEDARFAGARDSAATLFGMLVNRYPGTRWASLAELRLGMIHLLNDRYSAAYGNISRWGSENPYAVDNPEYVSALAEASFLTGRYERAAELYSRIDMEGLDPEKAARTALFRIRALARTGEYGAASRLLVDFLGRADNPLHLAVGWTAAVELYHASGSPWLAGSYLERIPESNDFHSLAMMFSLEARLAAGEDPDELRKEFDDYEDAPWNSFFRLDPAFMAYRGQLACYARLGNEGEVSDVRDEFRREYPEQRGPLSELMLDEIEFLISRGETAKASTMYEDLRLLFEDVYPGDRALWVGYRLERARANLGRANELLTRLSTNYPWSRYGVRASAELARLHLEAGQVERAVAMIGNMDRGVLPAAGLEALRARTAEARGDWRCALEHRKAQWGLTSLDEPSSAALLGWAESAGRAGREAEAHDVLSSFWSPDREQTGRARHMLARYWQDLGNREKALEVLEAVVSYLPGRSDTALRVLFRRGVLLQEMGMNRRAREAFEQLEQRAVGNSDWLRIARTRLRELSGVAGGPADTSSGQPQSP